MRRQRRTDGEVPPTAGLPPAWRDLLPPFRAELALRAVRFLRVEQAQVECSGTASLVIALTALRRHSDRRKVIVPAYTCPLVALAVAHCGLSVVVCDLAPQGLDLDAPHLQALCDQDTLAIIPTHLGGRVADVDTALACARRVGAWVIEDAAQALGAQRGGRTVGLDGDIGFFSLAVGKGLTTYEGGVLIARDAGLRDELARVSAGLVPSDVAWELKRCAQLLGYHALYRPALLRWAYGVPLRLALRRGDPVAAVGDAFPGPIPLHRMGRWRQSVGAHAFARLPAFLDALAQQAQRRRQRLARIAHVGVVDDPPGSTGVWPFLMLRVADEGRRDAILARLWGAGLGVGRLFIHALPDYAALAAIVPAQDVPNARAFAACTLTISNSPWLDDEHFERICAVLESTGEGAVSELR